MRILYLHTGYLGGPEEVVDTWEDSLDYRIYNRIPRLWRKFEQLLRLDFVMALKARQISKNYDLISAGSEKVGLPLALFAVSKPLVVVAHNMAHPLKRLLGHLAQVGKRWTQIGYVTIADRELIHADYHVPPERFFIYLSAPLEVFTPAAPALDGPVFSIGVAKRDYSTLIAALQQLPGCQTQIHISSRYRDFYQGRLGKKLPEWVHLQSGQTLSTLEIVQCYQKARFVVLPLVKGPRLSAGVTTALEAHSAGKAVIATRTAGIQDIVIDGVTGYLVPAGEVNALKEAIQKLWNDPALAHQMGQAGRKHVEAHFSPDIMAEQFQNALAQAYRSWYGKNPAQPS